MLSRLLRAIKQTIATARVCLLRRVAQYEPAHPSKPLQAMHCGASYTPVLGAITDMLRTSRRLSRLCVPAEGQGLRRDAAAPVTTKSRRWRIFERHSCDFRLTHSAAVHIVICLWPLPNARAAHVCCYLSVP